MGDVRTRSISVFFPAYNDAPSLPRMIRDAFDVLREHAEEYEVIVVNDGSHDRHRRRCSRTGADSIDPHMRVVTHAKNRGYGGALRSGFEPHQGTGLLHGWRRPV